MSHVQSVTGRMSSFCDEVRGRRREILSVEVLVRGVDDAQRVDSGLEIKAFCKSLGSLWPDMWGMPHATVGLWGSTRVSSAAARVAICSDARRSKR